MCFQKIYWKGPKKRHSLYSWVKLLSFRLNQIQQVSLSQTEDVRKKTKQYTSHAANYKSFKMVRQKLIKSWIHKVFNLKICYWPMMKLTLINSNTGVYLVQCLERLGKLLKLLFIKLCKVPRKLKHIFFDTWWRRLSILVFVVVLTFLNNWVYI